MSSSVRREVVRTALVLIALTPAWVARPVSADQDPPRGEIVGRVVCRANAAQSYALYLPSSYSPNRAWPIVYAFDPGARGQAPVERFKDAAETYGFIVVGSHNSRNGPMFVAQEALNAMLADTSTRFTLDTRRLYTTGFSGGARVAVAAGLALGDKVAGVIGFGAGFPETVEPSRSMSFAYYSAAGTDDFNYPELSDLEHTLDALDVAHRFEVFEGGHAWPPAAVCTRAVEWMELRAMMTGRRLRDPGAIERLFARAVGDAEADEAAGRPYLAFRRYTAAARDFAGLRDVSSCLAHARRLERSDGVRWMVADLKSSVSKQRTWLGQVQRLSQESLAEPDGRRAQADLLALATRLVGWGSDTSPAADRMAARRVIVLAASGFSEAAASDRERGLHARAALRYRVLTHLRPEHPAPEYNLACELALSGNRQEAIEALRRAVAKGFSDLKVLETDRDLDSLRGEAAMQQILQTLGKR